MQTHVTGSESEALEGQFLEQIVQGLADHGYAILDGFISQQTASALRSRIDFFHDEDELETAGIGKMTHFQVNRKVRGDLIRWIEPETEDFETHYFIQRIRGLLKEVNRAFFLGLKDFESHFTYYPAGKFYKRHADQFHQKTHRIISFVCYLNSDWHPDHEGELVIYDASGKVEKKVAPLGGRLVVFKSELEHEVLTTHVERYSVTGWMLDQLVGLTFL